MWKKNDVTCVNLHLRICRVCSAPLPNQTSCPLTNLRGRATLFLAKTALLIGSDLLLLFAAPLDAEAAFLPPPAPLLAIDPLAPLGADDER